MKNVIGIIIVLLFMCNITMSAQTITEEEDFKNQITQIEVLKKDFVENKKIYDSGQIVNLYDLILLYANTSLSLIRDNDILVKRCDDLKKTSSEALKLAKELNQTNLDLQKDYNELVAKYNKLLDECE